MNETQIYNGILNIDKHNDYVGETYIIRPLVSEGKITDKEQYKRAVIKYAQEQIERGGFFSENLTFRFYYIDNNAQTRINEHQFLFGFLRMCLKDDFEIDDKKQFLSDFLKPIIHKVKFNTLQEFLHQLNKSRLLTEVANTDKLPLALELISHVIDTVVQSGSFKYRKSLEDFTVLEQLAKKDYSCCFIPAYEFGQEKVDFVYSHILNNILKHSYAHKSLMEKRLGYTAMDLAAFKENDMFINCALSYIKDITPYMTKSNIDDYKIRNNDVKNTISSIYEKTAIEKVLKVEKPVSNPVKNRSKI